MDSISGTTLEPLGVDHLSAIHFDTHNFLSFNNDGVIINPNSTTNDLLLFNLQPQSFSEAPTYATLTTRIASETSSNDNISFNSASNNINNSYVSPFVQILQEDEDEESDPEIVNQSNLPSTSASMATSVPTKWGRGRPPLSQEERDKRAAAAPIKKPTRKPKKAKTNN